jgi:hypothetical protein
MVQTPAGVWVQQRPEPFWYPSPQPNGIPFYNLVEAPPRPLEVEQPFTEHVQWEISPSQVDTFASCERKWGWEKLDGIEVPQKTSAQVGERVHAILEQWLMHATPPNVDEELKLFDDKGIERTYYPGLIARSGLHLLPPPGPHLEIENWIRPPMLTIPRGFWNGRVDCAHDLLGDPELIDHKTTTDLKWAKSGDDLRKDAQGLIYAWAAMHATGASSAHLRWIYYQSRKPYKTQVSYTRLGRNETIEGLQQWEERAGRMIKMKIEGKRALDLEPNPDACDRFGGCPHRLRCNLSPQQLMRSMFAMENLSLEARIDAARNAAGASQAPAYPGGYAGSPQLPGAAPAQYGQQPLPQYQQPAPQAQPQYQQPMQQPMQQQPAPQAQPQYQQPAQAQPQYQQPAQPQQPSFPTPWQPHSTAPGWEARQVIGASGQPEWEQRPVQLPQQPQVSVQGQVPMQAQQPAQHQGLLPPEASGQPVQSTLPQQDETGPDTSKVGDQFDSMNIEGLKMFAQQHGLAVPPRLREKNLRIAVRNAWRDKQSGAIVQQPTPAQAQQIPQQQVPQQQVPQQMQHPQPQQAAGAVAHMHQTLQNVAQGMPMPQAMQAAATSPAVQQAFGTERAPLTGPIPTGAPRGFVLFVNCVPQKTSKRVLTLSEAFGDCFGFVAQNANVPDYRMVEHFQGAPRVCVQIRSKQNVAPLTDDAIVVISTLSQEGKDVFGTLSELASEVVVGSAA